jgi:hypothetical protein
MKGYYLILLLLLIGFPKLSYSQGIEEQPEFELEQAVESMISSDEGDVDNSVILEDLTFNREYPININLANESELVKLNRFNFSQIQQILKYRKEFGFFSTVYELMAIDGVTSDDLIILGPMTTFELPTDSLVMARNYLRNNFISRVKSSFPQAKGYHSSALNKGAVYSGIPISLYNRYHLEVNRKLELGILVDNDAGEHFFSHSNTYGFDYYSGYLSYRGDGLFRQVTVGDYLFQVGQGLSFGGGGGLGKSANTMGILKFGQTLRPYTSSDENRFFRGVSAEMGRGAYKLVLFYSNKYRDANTTTDSVGRNFTSLQTSGYHRTLSEIDDERSLNEQLLGAYGELKLTRFKIGGLLVFEHFNLPMITGSSTYKAKSFSGQDNSNLGIDYQWALKRMQCFGEVGRSKNGNLGVVQGVVWHSTPKVSLSAYYRHFDPGFQAFYGSSLSESSGNHNETGMYFGLLASPFSKLRIFGYFDLFHFPWVTYSTVAPSSGQDMMGQLSYSITKKVTLYLKGKFESKPQKTPSSKAASIDLDERTTKWRLQGDFLVSRWLTLRSRCEYVSTRFNQVAEQGWLAFQDVVIAPAKNLTCWIRYCWFNTDGYNSRVYAYENDLLYSFSIPEFHGIGQRTYLTLKWSSSSHTTLYLKSGLTIHTGAESWGSGYDVTPGDKRVELRGLFAWRF